VLQEGAWADMLVVNGDPTKDIDVLQDYEHNFVVIIKDGTIYKDTLDQDSTLGWGDPQHGAGG
jgi:imidazolonepropionase-like amidohydrolase